MYRTILFLGTMLIGCAQAQPKKRSESQLAVIFSGDARTAYRDPAAIYHRGYYYLFFTLSETEKNQKVYTYLAMSKSEDLKKWSRVVKLTPKDQHLDYSSPGNIIRYGNNWVICFQSYPRPNYLAHQMPRYGTKDARLFIMDSKDLEIWSKPQLLMVKGANVPEADMGRMIDPYLLQDKDDPGKYWCLYKQNGVSMSYSRNLKDWIYQGSTESGENTCVLVEGHEYVLFHSPVNGIGIKRSKDLLEWSDWGNLITLGQKQWCWAKGRITAGMVIPNPERKIPGRFIMFFHGSGPKTEVEGDFDKNSSIGFAWSDDFINWYWNGKGSNL